MARLRTIGFETGDLTELNASSAAINSTTKRTGNYSVYVSGTSGNTQIHFPASRELYIGVAINHENFATDTDHLLIRSAGGTNIFRLRLQSTGALVAQYLTTDLFTVPPLSQDTWHYIEWHIKTDEIVGIVEVKIDGVLIDTFIGDTGVLNMVELRTVTRTSSPQRYFLDDIVINDTSGSYNNTWTGQPALVPAAVTADGDVTMLLRGGIDSGENWSQVSPIPASSTGYVYSADEEEYDLYEHAGVSVPTPETTVIYNLHVVVQAMVEAGVGIIASMVKTGLEEQEGDEQVISGTYQTFAFCHPTAESSASWTVTTVNSAQVGSKSKGASP
jgi:hypothetical protein